MGVYIKGMEMPTSCNDCPLAGDFKCNLMPSVPALCKEYDMAVQNGKRLNNCPLVEIPPHGDLIERDDLRASIRESIEECLKWADEVDKDTMMYARISQSIGTFVECSLRAKAAPTIIEAEEGEA